MANGSDGIRLRSHVFQSLAQPRMVDGVPYSFAMINTGLLFFVLVSFKFWYWLPVYYLLHRGFGFFGKKDENIVSVYVRYAMQAVRYQPWVHPKQKIGHRLVGFGRGSWL